MGTHVCDYGIRVSHSIVHDGWSWHEVAASMTRGPGTKKRILSRVKIYLGLKLLTVKKVKTDFYLFLSANNKSYLPPTIAVLWIQPEDIFFSSFPEHEYWHKRKTTTMFHSIPIPSASPTPPPLPHFSPAWLHTFMKTHVYLKRGDSLFGSYQLGPIHEQLLPFNNLPVMQQSG